MSEEDFIGRWSRRKREAARAGSPPGPEPARPEAAPADLVAAPPADGSAPDDSANAAAPAAAVDVEALPPLDSITAATDITAFLRDGVPLELSRAALRRAWSADPAIRDFVGLAENAWDFTDPDAMPGFGPLDCSQEQLRELVAKVIGETRRAVADLADDAAVQDGESSAQTSEIAAAPELSSPSAPPVAAARDDSDAHEAQPMAPDAAAQFDARGDEPVRISRRLHGGALPR